MRGYREFGIGKGFRMLSSSLFDLLKSKLGDGFENYQIPPPVFEDMQGEFVRFNADDGCLITRFPVLERYCNPYGTMQGGMLAAAIDNTLGPLSMLVAPPNVTRRLEITYNRAISPKLGHIVVTAHFNGIEENQLLFTAHVRDSDGNLLARARARHWIL